MNRLLCLVAAAAAFLSCSRRADDPAPLHTAEREAPIAPAPAGLRLDASSQRELGIQLASATTTAHAEAVASTGFLTVNEDAAWVVGSVTTGKIAQVLVRVGDSVRQGQVLAKMHSHEVHDSRAGFRQAKAELERRGVLAAQALRQRDRTRRLFALKAASREQMEAAETEYRSAQIAVENAETEVEKERVHLAEFLDVPVEGPRTGGDDHQDDFVPVKAPASGVLMERLATPGTVVTQGDHVFTIADLSTLWMLASVNEADLSSLRIGQPVLITVKAYPEETFTGRIIKLGEKLDSTTRTLQVRVLVPNPRGRLKPEMFASAEIAGNRTRATLHVPDAAVQELNGRSVVFVRTDDDRFETREVLIAGGSGGRQEIAAGLQPGEEVVVKGGFVLKSELLKGSME